MSAEDAKASARDRLLDAAIKIVRAKGFAATNLDEICVEAGVTKGAFFHHFKSKEEWAVAAAGRWSTMTAALFAGAPYHRPADPLDRILAYVAFRRNLIAGDIAEFTCLVGTMAQEAFTTSTAIQQACWTSMAEHAGTLVADIEAAMRARSLETEWTAESLALHTQAVIQGAFILAKASGDPQHAVDSIDHLYRYIEALFARAAAGTGAAEPS